MFRNTRLKATNEAPAQLGFSSLATESTQATLEIAEQSFPTTEMLLSLLGTTTLPGKKKKTALENTKAWNVEESMVVFQLLERLEILSTKIKTDNFPI